MLGAVVVVMALELRQTEMRVARDQQAAEQLSALAGQVKVAVEREYGRLYTELQQDSGHAMQLDWDDLLAAGVQPPCLAGGSLADLTCTPVAANRAGIDVWLFCTDLPSGQAEIPDHARVCDNMAVAAVTSGPVPGTALPRPTIDQGGFGRVASDGLTLRSWDRRLDLGPLATAAGASAIGDQLLAFRHLGRQTDVAPYLNRFDHAGCTGCSSTWGFADLNRMELDLDMSGQAITGLAEIALHDLIVTGDAAVGGDLRILPGPDLDGDGAPDFPATSVDHEPGNLTLPEVTARFDVIRVPSVETARLQADSNVTLSGGLTIPAGGLLSVAGDLDIWTVDADDIIAEMLTKTVGRNFLVQGTMSVDDARVSRLWARDDVVATGVVANRLELDGNCDNCSWR